MDQKIWIILCFCMKVALAQETGFFWQLTDLHYDPWYHINQESCNKNLSVLGKYGNFECDAPWELVRSSVKAMEDISGGREAEFILWSGDNPPHVKNYNVINEDIIMEITKNITDIILEAFPDKMVLPVLGNHDFYPKNQLPGSENDMYNQYVEMWDKWLNTSDIKATFRKGAYFTRMLSNNPKVRAVVLNTNLYLSSNEATEGQDDPGGQFAWFDQVMTDARQNGEKVHVFTHVPIGVGEALGSPKWLKEEHNKKLHALIVEHGDIILGYYAAHTHSDAFRLFYKEGKPVSSMFIPPSVTPWRARLGYGKAAGAHNPALRRYTFYKDTYQLHDVEQYFLGLEKANEVRKAEWILLYSFRQTYKLKDISTPEVHDLLYAMKQYGSELFHKYYDLNLVATTHDANGPCDCICKSRHLCAMEYVDFDEYEQCHEEERACDPTYPGSGNHLEYMKAYILFMFVGAVRIILEI